MKRKKNGDLRNLKIKRKKLNTMALKNQKKRGSNVRKVNGKSKLNKTVKKAQMKRGRNVRKVNEKRKQKKTVKKAQMTRKTSLQKVNVDRAKRCEALKKKKTAKILLEKFKTAIAKQDETLENKGKDPTEERWIDEEIGILRLEELLRFAASKGDCETIVTLHSIGVSIETEKTKQRYCDKFGFYVTPLHLAAAQRHVKCVEMLIQLGANINAQANFGSTPLHVAVQKGHLPCVKLLLKAGADCNLHMYASSYSDFPTFTTALHLAAIMNRPECVKYLIKYGANLEAVDIKGRTSLYIAASSGFSECVLSHLEHAPPSDFISIPCYESSDTPLHFAVKHGMLHCVQKLVQLGADVNHLNNRGLSPLHVLFADPFKKRYDVMPILKNLVLEGRNLNMRNALHMNMFCNKWYLEAVTFLIAYGASLKVLTESYFSQLIFIFSKEGTLDLLRCFINCMPVLPLLSSLKPHSARLCSLPEDMILQGSVPTEFIPVKVVVHESSTYALVIVTPQSWRDLPDANPHNKFEEKKLLIPMRQPHLDRLYEIVSDKVKALSSFDVLDFTPDVSLRTQILTTIDDFHKLQLQLFYEKAATCPRSLQQCCRFSIRQCMTPANLKHVGELPLPQMLKSYLLFGCYNPNST